MLVIEREHSTIASQCGGVPPFDRTNFGEVKEGSATLKKLNQNEGYDSFPGEVRGRVSLEYHRRVGLNIHDSRVILVQAIKK